MVESGHSRFPVIGEDRDQILGILLAKDLLRLQAAGDEPFEIREYMRPAVFVPESKRLNVLLKEFSRSHNHIAMVVDEYGGVCGLVTIEDVIEQIVGEIDDEHDVEDDQTIRREGAREFTVRALTPIADFNQYFGTAFSDEEYDTIGGLLMQEFGRLPRRGETIQVGELEFRVLRADRRRIDLVARVHAHRHRTARSRRVRSLNTALRGPRAAMRMQTWWRPAGRVRRRRAAQSWDLRPLNSGRSPCWRRRRLFALIRGLPPRRAGWTGAAFGAGLFAFGTYWLYTCIHVFGLAPIWLTLLLQAALIALMAAIFRGAVLSGESILAQAGRDVAPGWCCRCCGCCSNGCAAGR